MKIATLRADLLKLALAKRHATCLFMTEVPAGGGRLDVLAMEHQIKTPRFHGYEVKVSRSDFLRDNKWMDYMRFVHHFYFACPTGMINLNELPAEVGLVYWDEATGATKTVRRAKYRQITLDPEYLLSLLINRTSSDRHPFFSSTREYCDAWLEEKEDKNRLGNHISHRICQLEHSMKELSENNHNLKNELRIFDELKKVANIAGIYSYELTPEQLIKSIQKGVPLPVMKAAEKALKELTILTDYINSASPLASTITEDVETYDASVEAQ